MIPLGASPRAAVSPDPTPDRPGRTARLTDPTPGRSAGVSDDLVDEWGRQSFPASDPPANW